MINEIPLRTLTIKSKMYYGKYFEQTVGELLGNHKEYLKWVYYNVRSITYTDDILDKLRINVGDRIWKPGTHENLYIRLKQFSKVWLHYETAEQRKERIRGKLEFKRAMRKPAIRTLTYFNRKQKLRCTMGMLEWYCS